MKKYLKNNYSVIIKVFNNQIRPDKKNANVVCLNLWYPSLQQAVYLNVYKDNTELVGTDFTNVKIGLNKYYNGSVYVAGQKTQTLRTSGVKLMEMIFDLEQKEFHKANGLDFDTIVKQAHEELVGKLQERNF